MQNMFVDKVEKAPTLVTFADMYLRPGKTTTNPENINLQSHVTKKIKLSNRVYKPYTVGELTQKFAFIYDEDKEQDGITEWFNYKGLTYVKQ